MDEEEYDWRGLTRYARAEAARRLGVDHPDLEDVAQNALCGLHRATTRGPVKAPWRLVQIAVRHRVRDCLRGRERYRRLKALPVLAVELAPLTPEDELLERERQGTPPVCITGAGLVRAGSPNAAFFSGELFGTDSERSPGVGEAQGGARSRGSEDATPEASGLDEVDGQSGRRRAREPNTRSRQEAARHDRRG